MSLKSKTYYTVECDSCENEAFEGQAINAWEDKSMAVEMAKDNEGFIFHDGKDYCPNCTEWNENATKLIPKESDCKLTNPRGASNEITK